MTEIEQDLLDIEKVLDESKERENEPIDPENYEDVTNGSLSDEDVFIGRMINPAYSKMTHRPISEDEAQSLIKRTNND